MSKIIEFGPEARQKLSAGIDKLANAVTATLGPNGRNVVIANQGIPQSTKDGVTVAKSITLEDPTELIVIVLMVLLLVLTGLVSAGDTRGPRAPKGGGFGLLRLRLRWRAGLALPSMRAPCGCAGSRRARACGRGARSSRATSRRAPSPCRAERSPSPR